MLTVKVCLYLFRLNVQRELERASGLVSWGAMILLQVLSNIWLIAMVVGQFHDIAGWDVLHLAFLYGLSQISQGFMLFFFIQTWSFDDYVAEGKFDRMLLRPLPVLPQFLFDRTNFVGIFTVAAGAAVFIYAAFMTEFVWSASNLLQLAVIIVSGTFLQAGLFIILGCLAFAVKRTGGCTRVLTNLCEKTSYYPVTIFPSWMQALLTFILPYSFLAFYPGDGLFRNGGVFDLRITWIGLAAGAGIFVLSLVIFQLALRRYESSGS